MSSAAEADAALLFGRVWLERGRADQAAPHLERAIALRPEHPETNRWMAYLRVHQEAFGVAARHFAVALHDAPGDSPEHEKIALLRELAQARVSRHGQHPSVDHHGTGFASVVGAQLCDHLAGQ
jgi:tetratricopeptide (TPR) repeat protein